MALGRAGAMESAGARPQVLIVRDTRESGPMLEAALAAGVAEGGGDAWLGGVLPTPAASILVRRHGLDLAAVVSASHNPWQHNGVKFFGADGRKLEDDAEAAIEARVAQGGSEPGAPLGRVRELDGALDDYRRALLSAFRLDLSGRRVLLDCANGATYRAAPSVFERLGAAVETIGVEPDGRNINEGCGSVHPELLAESIGRSGAEIGFAFDGDGDRVVAVDAKGGIRDGDELLALCARHLAEAGALHGGVAVTVMSNYRLSPGDGRGGNRGGDHAGRRPPRDRGARGARLGAWRGAVRPHHLERVRADRRRDRRGAARHAGARGRRARRRRSRCRSFRRCSRTSRSPIPARSSRRSAVWEAVERESDALEGRGRVLVRASGTEPLVRVMVEAPTEAECDEVCARLVSCDQARSSARLEGRSPSARSTLIASPCAESSDTWASGPAATC